MLNEPDIETGATDVKALLVDPSLFTVPYDEALVRGLLSTGIMAELVGRPLREGETGPRIPVQRLFYNVFDDAPKRYGGLGAALKAAEHIWNSARFALSRFPKDTVVHFQWLPFPAVDGLLIWLLKLRVPVVVTVHDTMPFNGTPTSRFQSFGFAWALKKADRIIVHTRSGQARLVEAGVDANKIEVIPHGPLGDAALVRPRRHNDRWTLVAFGKMRPYKGLDVLVDALAHIDPSDRAGLRVIVAGEALMDLSAIKARISAEGLQDCIEFREGFFDDAALAALFAEADGFVFPYREIEASGVLYLVEGLERWIIASELGAFVDAIEEGVSGALVPAGDAAALGRAIQEAARDKLTPKKRLNVATWDEIANQTLAVYHSVLNSDQRRASPAHVPVPQFQDSK